VPFLVVAAIGLWLWSVADSFAITTGLGRAGPEVWPKIVLALLLVAALWGVAAALLGTRPDRGAVSMARYTRPSSGYPEDQEQSQEGKPQPVIAVAGLAAMLAYVGALPYLGYAVSTFLLLLAIMLLAGYRRLLLAVLIALLGSLALFFVFQRIAYVSLPLGSGLFRQFSIFLMALLGVR
jgi:hypothetical protein